MSGSAPRMSSALQEAGNHRLRCDYEGAYRDFRALHRAVQLGQVLRQTYANCMRPWLQYDDAAQKQHIKEWEERLRDRQR